MRTALARLACGLFALLPLCSASPATAAAPTAAVLTPVTTATLGQPVPLSLRLEGVRDDESQVLLFYRSRSANAWSHTRFEARGGGRWEAQIPASATRSLAVRYYVKIEGPEGGWTLSLGSPETPLGIDLIEAPKEWSGNALYTGGMAGLATALLGGLLMWRERRRRHARLDQAFWYKTLSPLVELPGPRLAHEVRRLCGAPLDHPVKGVTIFSREVILGKLHEVAAMERAAMDAELEQALKDVKFVGPAARAGKERERLEALTR